MAIEKGLYQAPTGVDEDMPAGDMPQAGLEIEIVDPEMVTLDDGSVEITIVPGQESGDVPFDGNLAEEMEEGDLASLSEELIGLIDSDLDSRKEWADTFVDGLDVLGLKYEERTEPWEGACGVYSTVLAEAAIRFQAETMSETFPALGPVKTKILGEETEEKTEEKTKEDGKKKFDVLALIKHKTSYYVVARRIRQNFWRMIVTPLSEILTYTSKFLAYDSNTVVRISVNE